MNSVIKLENTTAATAVGERGLLEAYADAFAGQRIVGKLLRFVKGDYIAGEDREGIAVGTVVTANMDALAVRWTKWEGNRAIDERAAHAVNGRISPTRNELDDDDASKWPIGNDGQPRDPWQFAAYLPLLSEGNQLFTFVANSRGAHAAIADLSRRYLNHARRHSDVLPKIKLEVDSYQHKTKAYGRIKVPDFAPAGWAPKTFFAAALAAAGYASESETSVSDPVSDPAANLDDEIPF